MEEGIHMKKRNLLLLLVTTTILVACGENSEESNLEENEDISMENIDNDLESDEDNIDDDIDNNEDNTDEFTLADVSLDISEGITEAYDFFDELYFSDAEIINEEIGLKSADVTVYLDDQSRRNIATLRAHTIEPENTFNLSINMNQKDFEDMLTNTDADGNKMAIEVADDAYEYAEKLIWEQEGHVYQLDGGRSVVSTNKENEIHPEDDRLLFYENRIPTNDELKTYDTFYQNIKLPTKLPEGFNLDYVSLLYDQALGFSKSATARIRYGTMGQNNEEIAFNVYGEYEEAPKLSDEDIREETILETPVQMNDEQLLFTLEDETYVIYYTEIPEKTILEIAESIIEQAD